MRYLLAIAAVCMSAPAFAGNAEHERCIDAIAAAYRGKARVADASQAITWDAVRSGVSTADEKASVEAAAAAAAIAVDAFINRLSDACEAMR